MPLHPGICHLEPCNQDAQYDTKYLVPKYLVPISTLFEKIHAYKGKVPTCHFEPT